MKHQAGLHTPSAEPGRVAVKLLEPAKEEAGTSRDRKGLEMVKLGSADVRKALTLRDCSSRSWKRKQVNGVEEC